jgi:Ca2+-binding EF-hand superfamily protein
MKKNPFKLFPATLGAALVLPAILVMSSPGFLYAASKDKKQPTAAEVQAYQKKLFKQLDQDKNKKLTEKEFVVAVLYDDFNNMDKDKNGRLTKAEFLKGAPKRTGAKEWKMMDPDGKGAIVFADVFKNRTAVKEMKQKFKELDKKGKGYVTLAEVLKASS